MLLHIKDKRMWRVILFSLVTVALWVQTTGHFRLRSTLLRSGVGQRSNQKAGRRSAVQYDEFGSIIQLDFAQKAVNKGRLLVLIRLSNGTLVGSAQINNTADALLVPQGARGVSLLSGKPKLAIALTGLAADARFLLRKVKERMLSFSHKYSLCIPLRQLCDQIGEEIRNQYSTGLRPLAVHAFLIECGALWEVDCCGVSRRITAGAAGQGSEFVLQKLEDLYSCSWTLAEAKEMLHQLWKGSLESDTSRISGSFDESVLAVQWLPDD